MHTAVILLLTLLLPQSLMGLTPIEKYIFIEPEVSNTVVFVTTAHTYEFEKESWLLDMQYPVDNIIITSRWGSRDLHDCSQCSTFHQGVDFTPGRGSPVYSIMDGVIVEVDRKGDYGVYVVVEHVIHEDLIYHSVYAHMQDRTITSTLYPGQEVTKGQQIGNVGSTGLSTGPHLHLEIRKNGVKVNPLPIFEQNILDTYS
jgi:murein DD-endopeptidase MepM/ murein hydrolase activator NlpD